ncbi:hypothetical protein BD289DRAFT_480917 [Coniella lustricola]|uniref:Roadblock/LAMTOR2 domain-containing protein n=1 Tax=Coniella lustricola TaxID=2025994 RepID=A0A2T3AE50_9PEZI|nr:hypothetical protein BD289DRAFT_480917 [Coniella lustricola]
MADLTTTNGADALQETLARLSKKPGVKTTIALDRDSGAILKMAGQISFLHSAKARQQQEQQQQQQQTPSQPDDPNATPTVDAETQGAEELAKMAWGFVNAAGGLVEGLDTEDELKLLRIRTRKQELVIVPDAKYLLIVVYEAPTA